MQIETAIDPAERVITIRFTPEHYDAFPPSPTAWLDGRIVEHNRDRAAAAHALLLLPFVSGRLCPDGGCGVDVARPLRELFAPRDVIIEGVELSPARIPSGTRHAILCDGSYRSAALLRAQETDLVFRVNESAYTTSIGPRNVTVASNFGLFVPGHGQLLGIVPAMAALVLFAEDLGVGSIVLPIHDLTREEAELFARLTALLAAVNIGIQAPFLGKTFNDLSSSLPQSSGLEIFLAERHEHTAKVEDLPDFWLARLLSAGNDTSPEACLAISRLMAFRDAGHPFAPGETALMDMNPICAVPRTDEMKFIS